MVEHRSDGRRGGDGCAPQQGATGVAGCHGDRRKAVRLRDGSVSRPLRGDEGRRTSRGEHEGAQTRPPGTGEGGCSVDEGAHAVTAPTALLLAEPQALDVL